MTVKDNTYVIAALKDRRATLAGEVIRFKEGIRYRLEHLAHLDATLRILDPDYEASTVPPKRLRRVTLFAGGELNRLILDALRRADGQPLSNPEIADAIIAAKGYGPEARPALIKRVRDNLNYLKRRHAAVRKVGTGHHAKWALAVQKTGGA